MLFDILVIIVVILLLGGGVGYWRGGWGPSVAGPGVGPVGPGFNGNIGLIVIVLLVLLVLGGGFGVYHHGYW